MGAISAHQGGALTILHIWRLHQTDIPFSIVNSSPTPHQACSMNSFFVTPPLVTLSATYKGCRTKSMSVYLI